MIKKTGFLFVFTFMVSILAQSSLKEKIDAALQKIYKDTYFGILVINPMTGDTIYSNNPSLSLIPASNTKLFTTAVALSLLGPDYKISTKLFTTDTNLKDGVINGNLYIKGYGQGTFTRDDLEYLVTQLKQQNINKITGDILGDDSFFDSEYFREEGIEDEGSTVKLPPISALIIDRNQVVGYKKIKRRKRWITKTYVKFIDNPPVHLAELLRNELLRQDIIVDGGFEKSITPKNSFEVASVSIPLKEFIAKINKRSDNYLAECLFKIIGAVTSGEQGNSFNSAQAIHKFLDDNDIFDKGTRVVDGSGISRSNKITSGAIVGLLEVMYLDLKNFDYYFNSLSVAGVDGTLGGRMEGTYAENNFRGKTGTLGVSSSLSGYLKTKSGDDLIVSMIFQFSKGGNNYYRKIENEIIEILAEYDYPAN